MRGLGLLDDFQPVEMPILDRDETRGDPVSQEFLDGPRHGSSRLSRANHDDPFIHVSINGREGAGTQPGFENRSPEGEMTAHGVVGIDRAYRRGEYRVEVGF